MAPQRGTSESGIDDFKSNGTPDLKVRFDRQAVLEALGNGEVDISITGVADGSFFQEEIDSIRVIGANGGG